METAVLAGEMGWIDSRVAESTLVCNANTERLISGFVTEIRKVPR